MHSHRSPAEFGSDRAHLCLCSHDDSSDDVAVCFVEVWLLCRRMESELLSVSVANEVLRWVGRWVDVGERRKNRNMFAFGFSGLSEKFLNFERKVMQLFHCCCEFSRGNN